MRRRGTKPADAEAKPTTVRPPPGLTPRVTGLRPTGKTAAELKEDVPEEFKGLVPDLPPGQLIKWLRDANTKGLFTVKAPESLDKKRPSEKKPEDLSGLSPQAMMARGYK